MKFNSNIFNECKCQDFDLLNESMNVAKSHEHKRTHIVSQYLPLSMLKLICKQSALVILLARAWYDRVISSILVLNFSLHLLHLNFFLLKNSNFILRLFTAIDIKSSTNQVLFPLVSFAGNNNTYSSTIIIDIYYYHN